MARQVRSTIMAWQSTIHDKIICIFYKQCILLFNSQHVPWVIKYNLPITEERALTLKEVLPIVFCQKLDPLGKGCLKKFYADQDQGSQWNCMIFPDIVKFSRNSIGKLLIIGLYLLVLIM